MELYGVLAGGCDLVVNSVILPGGLPKLLNGGKIVILLIEEPVDR